jgi:hypothetical protein
MGFDADVDLAYERTFLTAMEDSLRLVRLHRQVAKGRGRRSPELSSLNRSVVVLAIAAWQAYVEALAAALLNSLGHEYLQDTRSGRTLAVMWNAKREELARHIDQYSTANSDKTLSLLGSLGLDPKEWWTWGTGPGALSSSQVRDRLNQWVKVRHAIAHGSQLPAVRVITRNRAGPAVRLKDAEACIGFVQKLARQTNLAARSYAKTAMSADARVRSDQLDTDYLLGRVEDLISLMGSP